MTRFDIDYPANHPAFVKKTAEPKYRQWRRASPDLPYPAWVSEIEASARIGSLPCTLIALAVPAVQALSVRRRL